MIAFSVNNAELIEKSVQGWFPGHKSTAGAQKIPSPLLDHFFLSFQNLFSDFVIISLPNNFKHSSFSYFYDQIPAFDMFCGCFLFK